MLKLEQLLQQNNYLSHKLDHSDSTLHSLTVDISYNPPDKMLHLSSALESLHVSYPI
jgi:hypothetical protein